MRSTPGRKGPISPSVVSRPSGKNTTTSPSASIWSMRAKASSISAGFSLPLAIGMAPAARNTQFNNGRR